MAPRYPARMPWTPAPRWDKRNKRWHVTVRGKHYNLGRDYQRACRRFAEIMADAGEPSKERRRPLTVSTLVGRWLSDHAGEWRKYCLVDWAKLEEAPIARLPSDTLERLDIELRRRGNSPQTRRHKINACARVCRWAVDQGWIPRLPRKPKIPTPKRRPRDLTVGQVRDLFASLEGPRCVHARRIILFILATGCRPSEARRLRHEEVAMGESCCHLAATKTGGARTLYLGPVALAILEDAARENKNTGYVFKTSQGRPYTRCGLAAILYRRGVSVYQLRHTFAQRALETLPIEDVAGLLGHANLQTVQVYAQVRAGRLKKAAASLTAPVLIDDPARAPSD